MTKFFALFFFALLTHIGFAFAADNATSRGNGAASISIPQFYEEQIVRQRDGASQTPVYVESPIDSTYIIGPGDFFEILLPNGNEGVQVSPEGTVAIQGCGIVDVNGLPLFEVKKKILEKLKARYDSRFVGVHLVQLRKFLVNVQGAVWSPGQILVRGQTRAREAIYNAGSYKSTANRDSIYIYRKGDTIATTENPLLEVGDIIEVPHKEWRKTLDLIYGDKTITVPYVPGKTIKEYAKDAGIEIKNGYSEVSVKNGEDDFTRWINISQIDKVSPEPLSEISFNMQAPFVYVGGAVAAVGKVPYNSSMHAVDYVAASGVAIVPVTTGAFSRISVLRNGEKISIDWASGEILPNDYIEIPRSVYDQVKDFTIFLASALSVIISAVTLNYIID